MTGLRGLAAIAPLLERGGRADAGIAIDAAAGRISIDAPGGTNLFCDPRSGTFVADAPRLLLPLAGDGWLRARVAVAFASTFDVGALLAWVDERRWAKLCFERLPDGSQAVVSVVNRGRSDDATGFAVAAAAIDLRIARLDGALAFHASPDGRRWRLVRYFELGALDGLRIGFAAHGSRGAGVRAEFTGIALSGERLADIHAPD